MPLSSYPASENDYLRLKSQAGQLFTVTEIQTGVASLSDLDLLITTAFMDELHVNFSILTSGDAEFIIYEDSVITANGTALTAFNNKRSSPTVLGASFYRSPTISSIGAEIYNTFNPGQDSQLIYKQGSELILKSNSNYVLKIINTSSSSESVSIGVQCYES